MHLRCPCKGVLCHSSFVKKRWSIVQKQENDKRRASVVGLASKHLLLLCSYSDDVRKEEDITLDMGTLIQRRVYSLCRENGQVSGY